MPELSRTQVAVYGAIAVALLFIGARAVRGEGGETTYDSYSTSDESSISVEEGGSDVVIDVTGAVRKPGVYRMPAGSRVNDAVKRAGGSTARASLDSINLAARLADGQQVVVPEEGSESAVPGAETEDGPISLGSATAAELDTIDGIGPVTAEGIIAFREEHGGLSSIDQLDQISGIGPATMEALRDRLQP
ncbi:MAG: helix-hairpin-helix domain-containing protein [Actinobacteria bacterium]|nr:helix-hairpin-helix domain-containing protein [Actinomycetota bacterium]